MSDVQSLDLKAIGARIRACRTERGIKSLDKLADHIETAGFGRHSTAKLSRIEAGIQPVTLDILEPLVKLTGIPPQELRPDLAALMQGEAAE